MPYQINCPQCLSISMEKDAAGNYKGTASNINGSAQTTDAVPNIQLQSLALTQLKNNKVCEVVLKYGPTSASFVCLSPFVNTMTKYCRKFDNEKAQNMCMGFEPRTTGWQDHIKSLSNGAPPSVVQVYFLLQTTDWKLCATF